MIRLLLFALLLSLFVLPSSASDLPRGDGSSSEEIPLTPPRRLMVAEGETPLGGDETSDVESSLQSEADEIAPEKPAPSVRPRSLAKRTTHAELPNGLTILVRENHAVPVATVRCFVKNTGSAFEAEHLGSGLSHLLEHLVAGGSTTKRNEKEISRIVERIGGEINAYTADDTTCFHIDSTSEHVFTAIELVADMMQHAAFEPGEFERELKVVRQELRDGLDDRERVLWNLLNKTRYLASTARHPIIGYVDILETMTREDAVHFYRERYIPNNMVLVVVGDVRTEEILEAVAGHFAGTPRGIATPIVLSEEPIQLSPRQVARKMDGRTCDFILAWPTIRSTDPDLYALDLIGCILTGGESARLFRKLVYEKQLVLNVQSVNSAPSFTPGTFCIVASCLPEHCDEAGRELRLEMDRLRTETVTEKELAKAKKIKEAELVFAQQSIGEVANTLARDFLSTGDPCFDETYLAGIRRTTAEDLRRAAERYFVPERINRIVIGPNDTKSEMFDRAADTTSTEPSEIMSTRLSNGLRVLIRRRADLPLVSVRALALGSTLVENDDNSGCASLLAEMLDKGNASRSAEQIADYFDSIGGYLEFTCGRSTVTGNVIVLKEDFETSTAILAECLTTPTFPRESFEQVQALALGNIAGRFDHPISEIFAVFTETLPKTSPYSRFEEGTKQSVERLTCDDVKRFYKEFFCSENMLVTVFGDVDPDGALKTIEATFGKIPSNPHFKPIDFLLENTLRETIVRHKRTGKDTGLVLIGYPMTSLFDEKETLVMRLLSAVLSDGRGPNGWLFHDLRGEGLVYQVQTTLWTGPAPGYFIILAQTAPDQLDEVVRRIDANLDKLKNGEIPSEDFERVRQRLVARHAQSNVTISEQSYQAGLDELYGFGFDYDEKFSQRVKALTLEEVVATAQKILSSNRVLVTTSPDPR